MDNQIIRITMQEADVYALDYFTRICGFHREGAKYEKLLKKGMEIKGRIEPQVDIRAIVSSFDSPIIFGNTAKMGDVTFVCNAFEQVAADSIQKIYAYILTAGVYELSDDTPILEQLYADIWGTAYVDAGLEVLKDKIRMEENNSSSVVLDSFGPGYYGMDVDQVGKFFRILDGEKIGVKVRNNCLMLPLKSCSGFYIAVDDESKLPAADCKNCRGGHKGCEFCQAVIKRRK